MRGGPGGGLLALTGCIELCDDAAPLTRLQCRPNPDGGLSDTLSIDQTFVGDEGWRATEPLGCRWEVDAAAGTMRLVPVGQICHTPNETYLAPVTVLNRVCDRPPTGVWLTSAGTRSLRVTSTDAGVTCELL